MSGDIRLRIGLCDDEAHIHEIIEDMIEVYAEENEITYELEHLYSGTELLDSKKELDFLFLDIDMPGMDGIETAHLLNTRGLDYKIIMLTSKVERFKEAFKIGAFRFVTKPILRDELFEAIDEVREHIAGRKNYPVYRDGVRYEVAEKEILYIMADGNATKIFTKGLEFRSEKSLRDWAEELDERLFFGCHRSYIVNLGKIVHLEKDNARMITDEKVPIARRKRTELMQAFIEYDTKRR